MQEVDGTRIPELKNIVSESLQLARKLGASQAEADVSLQKGLTTTVRLGEVETVEYQRDRGMGITVYFGQRKGSASTADLSSRAVAETVEKACDIARYTAEDELRGPRRSRRAGARHSRSRSRSSLGPAAGAGGGNRAGLRGRGTRGGRAHHQFRGRQRQQPSRRARLRQLAWISRGLSRPPVTA